MLPYLDGLIKNELMWFPEFGIGYYPVKADPLAVYNENYFHRYETYTGTDIEHRLTAGRVDLVLSHCKTHQPSVVDVGIGAGHFVMEMNKHCATAGIDINPYATKWLDDRNLLWNQSFCDVLTCWDVIEHLDDPTELFSKVREYICLSTPIYDDAEHILRSRHYRKDEHFWYFTPNGISKYMNQFGFMLMYTDNRETDCGRDHIGSFVFKRIRG